MKKNFMILLILCCSMNGMAQIELAWDDLADISFSEKYIEAYDAKLQYPEFSEEVRRYEGKKVTIIGYFLDMDPLGEYFILSENPLYACFFCGNAGTETVIELAFDSMPDLDTDDFVKITGILKLNSDEMERLPYILTNCSAKKIE